MVRAPLPRHFQRFYILTHGCRWPRAPRMAGTSTRSSRWVAHSAAVFLSQAARPTHCRTSCTTSSTAFLFVVVVVVVVVVVSYLTIGTCIQPGDDRARRVIVHLMIVAIITYFIALSYASPCKYPPCAESIHAPQAQPAEFPQACMRVLPLHYRYTRHQ